MISGASEAHVQQADSFASVTLCHLPAHGGSNGTSAVRGEGSVTQRSFFLLTERPWPIANPALSEWIGGIEATFVGLRTDVEGISFAPALEARKNNHGPLQAFRFVGGGDGDAVLRVKDVLLVAGPLLVQLPNGLLGFGEVAKQPAERCCLSQVRGTVLVRYGEAAQGIQIGKPLRCVGPAAAEAR